MAHRARRIAATTVAVLTGCAAATAPLAATPPEPGLSFPPGVRIATFNVSLHRRGAGDLVTELQSGTSAQAASIARIIERADPDILLLNEFDHDEAGAAIAAFGAYFAAARPDAAEPRLFDHIFIAPSNTGIPSGLDLDNDGAVGGPGDALGFGVHRGQYGMVVLSKYPIVADRVRTFQRFRWTDMPGALLPDDPRTAEPADWFSPEELQVVRLSSKSHWDVPVEVDGQIVHILAAHPTPPVFDGEEDRNGRRNHDEIRFWVDYVTPGAGDYIVDDQGLAGGIAQDARFVLAGDQNADPFDGDSTARAARQLTDSPRFNRSITPSSLGGISAAATQGRSNHVHGGNPSSDTADFRDDAPGNLRVDYVLPAANLPILAAGVVWPVPADDLFPLVDGPPFRSSDHRLVWVDVSLTGAMLPGGASAGTTTPTSAVLSAGDAARGDLLIEWSRDSSFASITGSANAVTTDPPRPATVTAADLEPDTTYFLRAVDAAGRTAGDTFRTRARAAAAAGEDARPGFPGAPSPPPHPRP